MTGPAIPITVEHGLPAKAIEVVPAVMAADAASAVTEADGLAIVDAASLERANALAVRLHTLDRALAAHGERIKKPLNSVLKAVRECLDRAANPVASAKESLKDRIGAYNAAQRRIAEEAQRKAEAEHRERVAAAEAERRRLQAEADAKAKADAEELSRLLGEDVKPAEVVVQAPPAPAPVAVAKPQAPGAPSPVTTRKVPKLDIFDPAAVPVAVGGQELRPIDRVAVRRLLDAGVDVPGARMVMEEQTVMARGVA